MTPPEFSRPVPLAQVSTGGYRQEITAQPEERAALAARFDLLVLDRLSAAVRLSRRDDGSVLLEARFEAEFEQACVITLEPVRGSLSASFALCYGPPGSEPEDPSPAAEAPAFEPLWGDVIDIGEAVAQELSLQLPPYPRLPDAAVEPGIEDGSPTAPFAVLAQRRRQRSG